MEMVQQADRVLNHEGIRWFQPHGGQEEFIDLVAQPGGLVVVSGAGNGWGKSQLIVAIFAAIIWPDLAPSCFAKHQLFSNWPHPKRARIYSTPAELEDDGAIQIAIRQLFPRARYSAEKAGYSYLSKFDTDTGWTLDMFSYERDESQAAGPNIGLQAFNEPPPEALYKEAIARTRAGGIVIGGMTSLLSNPWVVDGLFNKADGGLIRVRYGASCENCKTHGKNGHLDHDKIMAAVSQHDPDEREARLSGKPLVFSGRIFKSFDRNFHVAKEPIVPPSDGVTHYQAIDPAIGKPIASIWSFVDASGALSIYDESPMGSDFQGAKDSNLTVSDYANLFRGQENGRSISTRIMDRHFGNVRRTLGGKSLKEEFGEQGLDFIDSYAMDASVEVETGIMKVKEYLKFDKSKPIDNLNRPKLIVSPTCKNTIAALERWSRDPKTGKPKEDFKDFADCVRYLVMSNPEHEVAKAWPSVAKPHYGVS